MFTSTSFLKLLHPCLLLIMACTLSSTLMAQSANWQWAKRIGAQGGEYAYASCVDQQGNLYIGGDFDSPLIRVGANSLVNNGNRTLLLAKYDPSGNVIWAKAISGTGVQSHSIAALKLDYQNNIILTGYFSNSIAFGPHQLNATYGNIYVAKCDTAGNFIWASTTASPGDRGESKGIGVDAQNNVYIAGGFISDSLSVGRSVVHNPKAGTGEVFLAKFDAQGNGVWAKKIGGVYIDDVEDVSTDSLGNSYVVGQFNSPTISLDHLTLTNTVADSSSIDWYIAKYDSSGAVLWAESAGGDNLDYCREVEADNKGNVYIVGSFYGDSLSFSNSVTYGKSRTISAYVMRLNSSGSVIWNKTLHGYDNYSSQAVCMSYDRHNNLYVGGRYYRSFVWGSDTLIDKAGSGSNLFVAHLDPNGDAVCARDAKGRNTELIKSISNDNQGNVYITGFFQGDSVTFDNDSLHNASVLPLHDIFVAKLNACPAVIIGSVDDPYTTNDLKVYPNPAQDVVFIEVDDETSAIDVSLYDLRGKELQHQVFLEGGEVEIDVSELPAGTYVIRAESERGTLRRKLIKQ